MTDNNATKERIYIVQKDNMYFRWPRYYLFGLSLCQTGAGIGQGKFVLFEHNTHQSRRPAVICRQLFVGRLIDGFTDSKLKIFVGGMSAAIHNNIVDASLFLSFSFYICTYSV